MEANVVGLIVLDNGLACPAEADVALLSRFPVATAGNDAEASLSVTIASADRLPVVYETTFLRADLEQLQHELQDEFRTLLVRLFETR